MDPPPVRYAQTSDDVSIAYSALGAGPTSLLLHPLQVSHLDLNWRVPQFREAYELITQEQQLILHDPRATGLSGPAEDLSREALLRDIQAVVIATGNDRLAIIAVNQATWLAVRFAIAFPGLVSCLVFLAPEIDYRRREGVRSALRAHTPALARQAMRRLLNPDLGDSEGAIRAAVVANTATWNRLGVGDRMLDLVGDRVEELLPLVTCPALVVHYPNHTLSDGITMGARLPNARLVTRQGRNAPLMNSDLPDLFALIHAFIGEHAGRSANTESTPEKRSGDATPLSPRETEVLRLITTGATNAEIGEELVISRATVSRHVSNMLGKTGLKNRTDLTRYALERGLGGPGG